jgi:hypothetical protein
VARTSLFRATEKVDKVGASNCAINGRQKFLAAEVRSVGRIHNEEKGVVLKPKILQFLSNLTTT